MRFPQTLTSPIHSYNAPFSSNRPYFGYHVPRSILSMMDPGQFDATQDILATGANISPIIDSSTYFDPFSSIITAVNAWSVSGDTLNSPDLASNLFASSLFPYLVFLYFLARPETKTPKLTNFGFQFLLVFVFATIPAGILSKVLYNDILANVDYLHFAAESLLTVTNLLIISGFRSLLPKSDQSVLQDSIFRDIGIVVAILAGSLTFAHHMEPANALSLPTWVVHTSSLIEWLYAMELVWNQSEISGNPRWKGLTWGMLPAHASGFCACTFHFFYNSPQVYWLVVMQAALTVLGNCTLAYSAYRIYNYEKNIEAADPAQDPSQLANTKVSSNVAFWTDAAFKSLVAAALVKYGELYLDFPFDPSSTIAAMIIAASTVFVGSRIKQAEETSKLGFL